MPHFKNKKDERLWQKAKSIVEHIKNKPESKFKSRDFGLVVHIMQNMRPKKKKKSKKGELQIIIASKYYWVAREGSDVAPGFSVPAARAATGRYADVEQIFEQIRQEKYSNRPSRMGAKFVTTDPTKWDFISKNVYEVEISGNIFNTDGEIWTEAVSHPESAESWAEDYWNSEQRYIRLPETLVQGEVKVIKKVLTANELPLTLNKIAISVIIDPYEPLIEKAIAAIDKVQPGYFSQIKKIVVEQSAEAGDPFHYGKVKDSERDTIYISVNAVRSAMSGQDEDSIIKTLAGVLAHEMGHLKSNMQGGEGPAETEEHRMLDMLSKHSTQEIRDLVIIADALDLNGFDKAASIIDQKIDNIVGFNKNAFANTYINPTDVADTIIRIVYHFAQKVKPESQKHYLDIFAYKLRSIDDLSLSTKKKNPGAGLGASISIIKNLLAGHTRIEINQILDRAVRGITNI